MPVKEESVKGSDVIAKVVSEWTDTVFTGQGGCVVHLVDSLHKVMRIVPCLNEQGAAIAAEAHARVSGKLGVAVATSGPGAVNLLQGIACAYFDSTPVLYITGQVPTGHLKSSRELRQRGFQETDVVGMVKPVTKMAVRVDRVELLESTLRECIRIAMEGRSGPVLLDVPDDVQRAEVGWVGKRGKCGEPEEQHEAVNLGDVWEVFKNSQRPVVVLGRGVHGTRVREFLERVNTPFVTTWGAKQDFTEEESVGTFGVSSSRIGNWAVQHADVLLCLGTRLDTHHVGSDARKFAPGAVKIVVDSDSEELFKRGGVGAQFPLWMSVEAFLASTKGWGGQWLEWLKYLGEWRTRLAKVESGMRGVGRGKIDPYVFVDVLSEEIERTEKDHVVIADAGATLTQVLQGYKVRERTKMLFSAFAHSPMGYSIPAGIGARLALGWSCRVVCVMGDGAFSMNVQELALVERMVEPIKLFVVNNGGYGIIRQTQDMWLEGRHVGTDRQSGLFLPDTFSVAAGYGLDVARVSTEKELRGTVRRVLKHKRSMVCEVVVDKGVGIQPKVRFGAGIEVMEPELGELLEEFRKKLPPRTEDAIGWEE